MKLWPIIPIASAFCLGAFAAKKDPQDQSRDAIIVESAPQDSSLIPQRTKTKEPSGLLPLSALKKISFETIVSGNITEVAQQLLSLTNAQVTLIEKAIADHQKATNGVEEQLLPQATITEQSEDCTVITLPDDPQAIHDLNLAFWGTIDQAVGTVKGAKLLSSRPKLRSRKRSLTLAGENATILEAIDVDGKSFNPQYSTYSTRALESPWKEIVKRLGL